MKVKLFLIITPIIFYACTPKKTGSTDVLDSLAVDSMVQAENLAPATLAFNQIPGYTASNNVALTDSINFMLIASQEDLDQQFMLAKESTSEFSKPDFAINYIIAAIGRPSQSTTAITIDKAEVDGLTGTINVYVTIKHGEKQTTTIKPAAVFALERRDGVKYMQFYVNGKKGQEILMM